MSHAKLGFKSFQLWQKFSTLIIQDKNCTSVTGYYIHIYVLKQLYVLITTININIINFVNVYVLKSGYVFNYIKQNKNLRLFSRLRT